MNRSESSRTDLSWAFGDVSREVGEMSERVSVTPRGEKARQELLKRQDIVILSHMPISGGDRVVFEVQDLLPEQAQVLFKKLRGR